MKHFDVMEKYQLIIKERQGTPCYTVIKFSFSVNLKGRCYFFSNGWDVFKLFRNVGMGSFLDSIAQLVFVTP